MNEGKVLKWIIAILFLSAASNASLVYSQAIGDYRSKANGLWTSLSTWERYNGAWVEPTGPEGYPAQNSSPDTIEINHDVTLDVPLTSTTDPMINYLIISSNSLELSSYDFTVNDSMIISGTLSDNDVDGYVRFYGPVQVQNTGTWSSQASPSECLLFFDNIVNNSNNVNVDRARAAADIEISGSGSMTMDYLEYNDADLTIINTTTLIINLGLNYNDVENATFENRGTLYYNGSSLLMGDGNLKADYTGNTIYYSRNGDQRIKQPVGSPTNYYYYYHLITSGGGTKTLDHNINIRGNLIINSGTVLQPGARYLYASSVSGSTSIYGTLADNNSSGTNRFYRQVTIYPGGVWDFSAGNASCDFRGGLIHNGASFISGTGTYYFRNNDQTLGGTTDITFNGPVRVDGYRLYNDKTTTINGVLYGNGTWINNNGSVLNYSNATAPMAGGSFVVNTNSNTVNYTGASAQSIRAVTYYHLITSGGGTKTLAGNTTVDGTLTMTAGNINAGSYTLILANSLPSALNHTSGAIIGRFERFISQTGQNYFFPVGTTAQTQSLTVFFSNLSAGSLVVQYNNSDPGELGLPLDDDDGSQVTSQFTTGYWSALPQNGLASNNYNIDLDATGFGPFTVVVGTRILKRTGASGSWILDGSHHNAVGSVIRRTGMDGLDEVAGTHFGAGWPGPKITSQPSNTSACINGNAGFSVTATGTPTLTYQWYKAPGIQLTDGAEYNGTTTNSLTILSVVAGDAGSYYCVVTNGHGHQQQSNAATLSVSAGPAVTFGYACQKIITIDGDMLTGALTSFPVLIHITDAELRDTVQNVNGYDIIFSDADYNKLDHDLESYNPMTGELIVWVRIPGLTPGTDTQIRMFYSNPDIASDQSSPMTWEPGYAGVWHFQGDLTDATLNPNNGTNYETEESSGIVANGRLFDENTDNIEVETDNWSNTRGTVEVWVQLTGNPVAYPSYIFGHTSVPWNDRIQLYLESGNNLYLGLGDDHDKYGPIATLSINVPYHIALTWNNGNYEVFINGTSRASGTYTGFNNLGAMANIGNNGNPTLSSRFEGWRGIIDEVRVSNTVRSVAWFETSYDNKNAPLSFYTVSAQVANSVYDFEVCANDTVVYSVSDHPDLEYDWNVTGASEFSGDDTHEINVIWGSAGTGTVSLSLTNITSGCSASSPAYSVTKSPVPEPVITGNFSLCPNSPDEIYSVDSHSGHSYDWEVTGAIGFEGDGTNIIEVDWGAGPLGIVTVTETVIVGGCNSTASENVTLEDDTAPLITCPGDRTEYVDAGCDFTLPDYTTLATATDNCTAVPAITQSPAAGTVISGHGTVQTITLTADDGNGNTTDCTFDVTLNDNTDPVITCPGDRTEYVDAGCDFTLPDYTTLATATDNCTAAPAITQLPAAGTVISGHGTVQTITLTTDDGNGNTGQCTFDITLEDNILPTISCPGNINQVVDPGSCTAGITMPAPVTGDNCGILSIVNDFNGTNDASGDYPGGITTVVWTVTDVNNNIATCSMTVTVTDNELPVFNDCPGDLGPLSMDPLACGATVSWSEPTASDNCGVVTITRTDATGLNNGDLFPEGTTTISYSATDGQGNSSFCSFNVTVLGDNQPPALICPPDQIRDADYEQCYYTITGAEFDPVSATDNCSGVVIANSINGTATLAGEQVIDGTVITWNAEDMSGNTSQCSFTVTLNTIPDDPGQVIASINPVCQGMTGVTYRTNRVARATAYAWTVPPGAVITGPTNDTIITVDYTLGAVDGDVRVTALNPCGVSLNPGTFTVVVNPPLSPLISSSDADNIICSGESVTFTASGGVLYEFLLNGTPVQGPGAENTYTTNSLANGDAVSVYVVDPLGCSGVSTPVITAVNPAPTGLITAQTDVACHGEATGSVTVEGSGGMPPFLYSLDGGALQDNGTYGGLAAGNHYITIVDLNGCTTDIPVTITQPVTPLDGSILSQTDITCFGLTDGTVTVEATTGTGTSPYEYSIDGGLAWQGDGLFTALAGGNHTVTIRDAHGCLLDVPVTIIEPADLTALVTTVDVLCHGGNNGQASVTATGGTGLYSYLWSGGQTTAAVTNLAAGDHSVTVTDDNNCMEQVNFTIYQPEELAFDTILTPAACPTIPNGAIDLVITGGTAPYTVAWSDGAATEDITDLLAGNYQATVTDANNCEMVVQVVLPYVRTTCLIIPTVITPNNDSYNDTWIIDNIQYYPDASVSIFNRWGEQVYYRTSGYDNSWDGTHKGKPLPMDSYHYIIDLHNGEKPLTGSVTIIR